MLRRNTTQYNVSNHTVVNKIGHNPIQHDAIRRSTAQPKINIRRQDTVLDNAMQSSKASLVYSEAQLSTTGHSTTQYNPTEYDLDNKTGELRTICWCPNVLSLDQNINSTISMCYQPFHTTGQCSLKC